MREVVGEPLRLYGLPVSSFQWDKEFWQKVTAMSLSVMHSITGLIPRTTCQQSHTPFGNYKGESGPFSFLFLSLWQPKQIYFIFLSFWLSTSIVIILLIFFNVFKNTFFFKSTKSLCEELCLIQVYNNYVLIAWNMPGSLSYRFYNLIQCSIQRCILSLNVMEDQLETLIVQYYLIITQWRCLRVEIEI